VPDKKGPDPKTRAALKGSDAADYTPDSRSLDSTNNEPCRCRGKAR